MKKGIVLILLVLVVANLFSQAMTEGKLTGVLPQDANRKGIQLGRYLQFYDGEISAVSHIAAGDFTSEVPWLVSGDFSIADDVAKYRAVSSNSTGTLTQEHASMLEEFRGIQYVKLSYTVIIDTAFAFSIPVSVIGGICSDFTASLSEGNHSYYFTTVEGASTSDFKWTIEADASETSGRLSIDDVSITNYYESPLVIAAGASVILTTPTNGIELVLDPMGNDLAIVNNSAYFVISTVHSIPTTKDDSIVIRNDSDEQIVVYFYYTII